MLKIDILNTPHYLKILSPTDTDNVEHYFHRNATHLAPWEPLRSEDFYSTQQIRLRLENMLADAQQGVAFQFGIFAQHNDEMIGACNFTGVARGPFQACHLGYSLAQHAQGKGVMTLAYNWASKLIEIPGAGHIHTAAGFGEWPAGEQLVIELCGFELERH